MDIQSIQKVTANPDVIVSNGNVRNKVDKAEYKQLKESIKTLGVLQAITVYKDESEDVLIVVDGHQRLKITRELNLPEIPFNLIERPNGETQVLQHSLNTQRVNMTVKEEIEVFSNLAKTNKSKKDIAEYYGKSMRQINELIQLGNIHPKILKKLDFEDYENINDAIDSHHLKALSTYDQTLQLEAWNQTCDVKEEISNWDLEKIVRLLHNNIYPEKFVKEIFTKDELDKYSKGYKGKMNTSLELFELSKDLSPDFFEYAFEQKYPELWAVLINLNKEYQDNNQHWYNLKEDTLNIELTKIVNYKDPAKTIAKYKYFRGRLMNPEFAKPIKENKQTKKDATAKVTERPKYSGQAKKFFHVIKPMVLNVLKDVDPLVCNNEDIPEVFNWLIEDTDEDYTIGGWRSDEVKEKTSKDFIHAVTKEWFKYAISNCTLKQVNKLFVRLEMDTVEKMIKDRWMNDIEFKESVLSCMSIANLTALGVDKGKRVDMVAMLKENYKKGFPFTDIYQSVDGTSHRNTNWYDSMYLDTE